MNIERIKRLADVMRAVPPERYDQTDWLEDISLSDFEREVGTSLESLPKYEKRSFNDSKCYIVPHGFCGSAACVAGNAALDESFNEEGLFVAVRKLSYVAVRKLSYEATADFEIIFDDKANDQYYNGWAAPKMFFDLSHEEAEALFHGYSSDPESCAYSVAAVRYMPGFYTAFLKKGEPEVTPHVVARALDAVAESEGQIIKDYWDGKLCEITRQ